MKKSKGYISKPFANDDVGKGKERAEGKVA